MKLHNKAPRLVLAGALLIAGCAGGPLSTREKGAGKEIGPNAVLIFEVELKDVKKAPSAK